MSIVALHHVSIIVSDTSRSLRFYCDLLGLTVDTSRLDFAFPGAWININTTQQIHLLEVPNPELGLPRPAHGGRDRHIALWCDDFDALVQRLEAANIPITHSKSGRPAFFCRDPDDNAVEIIRHVICS